MPSRKIDGSQRRRLFAIAKNLGKDIEELRTIAEQYNTHLPEEERHSISALTRFKANAMIWDLQKMTPRPSASPLIKKKSRGLLRPDGKPWDYTQDGKWSQDDVMMSLVESNNWNIWEFRAWLKSYYHIDHERYLDNVKRNKAIEGLKAMLKRSALRRAQGTKEGI